MIAVKRSGPFGAKIRDAERSALEFFAPQPAFEARSTQSCAAARNLREAQAFDIMDTGTSRPLSTATTRPICAPLACTMRASATPDPPENMCVQRRKLDQSAGDCLQQKIVHRELRRAIGFRSPNTRRAAPASRSNPPSASTVNCGTVALLKCHGARHSTRMAHRDGTDGAPRSARLRGPLRSLAAHRPAVCGRAVRCRRCRQIDAALGGRLARHGGAA